jgi:YegS/Rv2252/BmrU family lipid kinase
VEKIFVVLNPASGRGGGGRAVEAILRVMRSASLPFDLFETTRRGEAIEVAREARCSGYGIVAAAGGDGTINEVVNGLAQAAEAGQPVGPLAILPVGTGNDFASMVGTPPRLEAAVQAIRRGRTRSVDLSHAQIRTDDGLLSRYFDNNLGIGFEAQVTVESYKITQIRGFAVYLLAVFRALRSYRHPYLQIRWCDPQGRTHRIDQESLMASIGNSRRTGGGFYVTPDAVIDDGELDLVVARGLNNLQILSLLPRVMYGAHRNHSAVKMARCSSISIQSNLPLPLHTDGEVITRSARALSITMEPLRLQVIV